MPTPTNPDIELSATPITVEMVERIRELTEGVEIDLDKPLDPDEE